MDAVQALGLMPNYDSDVFRSVEVSSRPMQINQNANLNSNSFLLFIFLLLLFSYSSAWRYKHVYRIRKS